MWRLFIVAFVVAAAIGDLRWRKIPRTMMVAGFAAGIAYHSFAGGVWSALAAAVLGFAVGMALFTLGAIGGGDVKLITALGALLGLSAWTRAMQMAIFAAAAMAIFQVLRHRAVRQTLENMRIIVGSLLTHGFRQHRTLHVNNPECIRSPFGVAAAVGTVFALWRG